MYNVVRDFGAVGDWTADDSVAFAKAATLDRHDTLIVPAATVAYRVRIGTPYFPTFQLAKSGITMLGDGERSLIKLDPASALGSHILNVNAAGVTIEGVAFDLNGVKNGICVWLTGSLDTDLRYLYFTNPLTGGVYIVGAAAHIRILKPTVTGLGYGIATHPASTVSDLSIQQGHFRGGAAGDAIEINTPDGGASQVEVLNNDIAGYASSDDYNNGIGIGFAHVTGGTIARNQVATCGLDGIHVEDGSCAITIAENPVRDCKQLGISINSSNPSRQTGGITLYRNAITGCKPPGIELGGTQPVGPVTRWGNTVDGSPWVD